MTRDILWDDLDRDQQDELARMVQKAFPGVRPADFWTDRMEPRSRADWVWHNKYGTTPNATWADENHRIEQLADAATEAAFIKLYGPRSPTEDKVSEILHHPLPPGEGHPDGRRIDLTPASSITMRPVHWLWQDRLPAGELSLFAGREDIGKSTVSYTLAAWITTGTMKGQQLGEPRAVLVAASEDSWEHTIVPRLTAAGADLDLVFRVDVITSDGFDGTLDLPSDLLEVEGAAQRVGAVLLLLDPLMSRLSNTLDSHKDSDVRRALEPLVALSHRTGMAVLGLIHVSKSSGKDTLTSIMASRAFTAVARSVLFAIRDPEDDPRRILGNEKNNLGRADLPTLHYRIVSHLAAETDDGPVWTGQVEWLGESDRSVSEVLAEAQEAGRESMHAGDDPIGWLSDYLLSVGGSKSSSVVKRAGKEAGYSDDVIKRAARKLGVVYRPEGFPRVTIWSHPQSENSPGESSLTTPTAPTGADQGLAGAPVSAVGAVGAVGEASRTSAPTVIREGRPP